jgi:hypothetical protein
LVSSENHQYLLMIARPIAHHNLHASWQRVNTVVQDKSQRLEFLELEDNYTWHRLSAGGAARWQRAVSDQLRQSLFWRASGQLNLHRLSVYGYWEQGKDLANETLFSTEISSTSVAGVSWTAPGAFTLQAEAFRNHLNSVINPESLFVLGAQGITPNTILGRSDDWNLFLRVSRQFSWGSPGMLGGGGLVHVEAPLTGSLAGYVKLHTLGGEVGAGDVWLVADTGQAVKTDDNGYFQLPNISEGPRVVQLDLDRLPADLSPPEKSELTVEIRSGQLSRLDMNVTPLESLEGSVRNVDGTPAAEGIVLQLLPRGEYTTTGSDGRFGFYNLPEGDYEVTVSNPTLPENAKLISPAAFRAEVRYGKTEAAIEFQYALIAPAPKPSKNVVVGQQMRAVPTIPSASKSGAKQGAAPGKGRVILRTTADNIMPHAASARPSPTTSIESNATGTQQSPPRWVAR